MPKTKPGLGRPNIIRADDETPVTTTTGNDLVIGKKGQTAVAVDGSVSESYVIADDGGPVRILSADGGFDRLLGVETVLFDDYALFLDGRNNEVLATDDRVTATENFRVFLSEDFLTSNDFDGDGDTLTVTSVRDEAGIELDIADGGVTYTPPEGFVGTKVLTYTVTDGNGSTAEAQIVIEIEPAEPFDPPTETIDNEAPVAVTDEFVSAELPLVMVSPEQLLANDFDPDGTPDELVFVALGSMLQPDPSGFDGVTRLDNGSYLLAAGDTDGPAVYSYTIRDADGATAEGQILVSVPDIPEDAPTPPDDLPLAT